MYIIKYTYLVIKSYLLAVFYFSSTSLLRLFHANQENEASRESVSLNTGVRF